MDDWCFIICIDYLHNNCDKEDVSDFEQQQFLSYVNDLDFSSEDVASELLICKH